MSRLKIISLCLLALISAIPLAGCRRSANIETAPEFQLELSVQPTMAIVGEAQLELVLTDSNSQPVEGAEISLRGDMTHPGMTPVLADADEIGDGLYHADWEWTMAGDWIVTATVELADGTVFERTFDLAVAGADMMEHDS